MKKMGSLMQGLKEKKIKCKVHGCNNNWIWSGSEQLKAMTQGKGDPPRRMCESCFKSFNSMENKEIPCASPTCSEMVELSRYSQINTLHQKYKSLSLCAKCLKKMETIKPVESQCKIEGCSNSWSWSPKDQLISPDGKIPYKMCGECYSKFNKLKTIEIKCKRETCVKTWTFTKIQQLKQDIKGIKKTPRLFCSQCYEVYNSLSDISIKCKISECENEWIWNKFSQLNSKVELGTSSPPQRMCDSCHSIFSETKEIVHKCRIPGCKDTWIEKRGSVFSRIKSGEPIPHKLCDNCFERLNSIENKEVECKNKKFGCKKTWLWKKENQLRVILKNSEDNPHPPNKTCPDCNNFMSENKAYFLKCSECDADIIFISSEYQLKINLGFMGQPENLCNDCRK
jgi:hypothetical protein